MTPLQFLIALVAATLQAGLRRLTLRPRRGGLTVLQEALSDALRTHVRLLQSLPPSRARALEGRLRRLFGHTKGVTITTVELAGCRARRFRPNGAREGRIILYLHGGAYVFGSSDSYRGTLAALARATGWEVVAPDYRLAPEHPYPAARDDCVAVAEAARRVFAGPIVVAGDSAGGGLALAVAQRTSGLAGLMLFSPWVDLSDPRAGVHARCTTDWVDRRSLASFAQQYLRGADPTEPGASPLYGAMDGLPPVLLSYGDAEALRDQHRALASRLGTSAASVSAHEDRGMVHAYEAMGPFFPAAAVLVRVRRWLDERF